jgi:hypothetical protein
MSQRLSTPQLSIRRANRAGRRQDGTIPVQHDESCILIGKPTQRGERHHSVWADYDKAAQAVTNTRKAAPPTVRPDAILKKQMSTIHADLDAIAEKGDYALTWTQSCL